MYAAIEIGPNRLKVSPTFNKDIFEKIKNGTRFRVKGYQYTKAHKQRNWDGYINNFFFDQTASSGLYFRIKNILKREGFKVEIGWNNNYSPKGEIKAHGLVLADFQVQLAELAVEYRVCTFLAPIRSGKTAIISAIINHIDHYPVCIVTKYRDLAKQTRIAISEHIQKKVGIFSESKFDPSDVWVTTYDALSALNRYRNVSQRLAERNKAIVDLIGRTKILLLDECQFALSKKIQKVFGLFNSIGYKIGLSGTPKPDKKTVLELESKIGPIIKKISYEKLIDSGRLAKPKVFIFELPHEWFDSMLDTVQDIYTCNIINNVYRNAFILEIIKKLWSKGKSSYVMVGRLEQGYNLQRIVPNSFFVHGDIKAESRLKLYKSVQDKKLMCLIGTVGKIGLNLPKLDAVINAEGWSSSTLTIQKMRSLTACEGKRYGLVIDFVDRGAHLFKASRKRLKIYYGLDGFEVILKRVPEDYFRRKSNAEITA